MATNPTILAATWNDGLFVISKETRTHEFAGQSVCGLARDARDQILAIVNEHSLCRRDSRAEWSTIATSETPLSCCVAVGDVVFVGTDDARVLRVGADGELQTLTGFDDTPSRDTWFAGSAIINGQRVGPPLGIRSMAATCDGTVLLANVHVGGIPRSTDGGVTWHPTIDVDSDVHEVCAHPSDPDLVIAAAAVGLLISRDGGATWAVEQEGLHASYCSAVAFSGDDILVSASADHFATEGAVYRRPIDGSSTLVPVGGGLPRWIDGIADTGCIATHGRAAAIVDKGGNLFVSSDAGATWSARDAGPRNASCVLVE